MASLTAYLSGLVADAFEADGLPRDLGHVAPSSRPDLGQFQCNGALPAAKVARKKPREIADGIAARLSRLDGLQGVSVAGPGFINLSVTDALLCARLSAMAEEDRHGVPTPDPQTIVLDFGGPNIAKPMHVGHLRSSIIGDSLQRLCRFLGHHAVSDVHMGDWGLQMGMVISEIEQRYPHLDLAQLKAPDVTVTAGSDSPFELETLEGLYRDASAACKADPARLEIARATTTRLQGGDPTCLAIWRTMTEISKAAMRRDFESLGVTFDLWKGEADVNDLIPELVDNLRAKGLAVESEGALVVPVESGDDRVDMPPLILLKSDGGVMYGTTDLATLMDRTRQHQPDVILYVVDQRQHLHFEQVFRVARRAGLDGGASLEHIGFGTMNGPDGKPFKTREGGVMRLQELVRMVTEQALARLNEAGLAKEKSAEQRQEAARQVGLAALKFADLSNHRTSNYIFDVDRFTRFEGRTGPYIQYAAVRMRAILRKAEAAGSLPGELLPPTDVDRDLVLVLTKFPDAIESAFERRAPDVLCDHLFVLAQEFSRFYAACHIISETDDQLRCARLGLVRVTLDQLVTGMSLLGIDSPETM